MHFLFFENIIVKADKNQNYITYKIKTLLFRKYLKYLLRVQINFSIIMKYDEYFKSTKNQF